MYAETGEPINLTCLLNTKEVDWHFKDKNLTTTIISNGLQLQVYQPIQQLLLLPKREHEEEEQQQQQQPLLKYRVTSDLAFTHSLTVFVQGEQDEGSYQCVDSVSESPVKKTIIVILSRLIFIVLDSLTQLKGECLQLKFYTYIFFQSSSKKA